MTAWIWTNVVLTLLAIGFVKANTASPHRLRFNVCFAALCAWLVPWNAFGRWLPVALPWPGAAAGSWPFAARGKEAAGSAGSGPDGYLGVEQLRGFVAGHAETVLIVATIAGAALFLASCLRYRRLVARLGASSACGRHLWSRAGLESSEIAEGKPWPPLRVQNRLSGACTTGIVSPTIWVHEELLQHPALSAALIHEYRHVRNGDNLYLWAITLVERLLWWNPLLRYLAAEARRLQELSCDEACARDSPAYDLMLKQLVLALSKPRGAHVPGPQVAEVHGPPQVANVHGTKSFNVRRAHRALQYYAMLLERQFDRLQAEHSPLQRELEALQTESSGAQE